jgi:hypothetical protein
VRPVFQSFLIAVFCTWPGAGKTLEGLLPGKIAVTDKTPTWQSSLSTWRIANQPNANQISLVVGMGADEPHLVGINAASSSVASDSALGRIGEDTMTAPSANCHGGQTDLSEAGRIVQGNFRLDTVPVPGFRIYYWLESASTTGIVRWSGKAAGPTGLTGVMMA